MGVFWIVVGAALIGVIIYAALADRSARRDGQVLVPVKEHRFGRTTFVRMERDEFDEQRASAILAKREVEKAKAEQKNGMLNSPQGTIKSLLRIRR